MKSSLALVACAALLLGGCSTDRIPFVYKLDIEQGNVVAQDMVAELQPGMSRDQVRFIMGTPLLVDPFTDDRWDYVYTFSAEGERREQRNVTLLFDGDSLVKVRGDVQRASGPLEIAARGNDEVPVPRGRPKRNRGLLAGLFDNDAIEVAESARAVDENQAEQAEAVLEEGSDAAEAEATSEQAQEQRRERVRQERRRDQQEEFYEDLLGDLGG